MSAFSNLVVKQREGDHEGHVKRGVMREAGRRSFSSFAT